jgi:putative transposase
MNEYKHEFRIKSMARVLGVSRSGYYAWLKPKQDNKEQELIFLTDHILRVFNESKRSYGSPRIYQQLKNEGVSCGRHRIARLMRSSALIARKKRKYKKPVTERHDRSFAANLLNRKFNYAKPNRAWISDVSYFWTRSGWLHLAIVMDLFSRRIIGWSMGAHVDKTLTLDALTMALLNRDPQHRFIHHCDQGAEYTNHGYQNILRSRGIISSMSRSGNCYDNAVAESFFKTIKTELVKKQRFRTIEEARGAIFEYIEIFYNRKRLHSTLGYLSPEEYERRACIN